MPTFESPLSWPQAFPRTPRNDRQYARFGDRSSGFLKTLTIQQSISRLEDEISAFTRDGHPWRIDPDKVVVSTDLRVRRSDGQPRSDQKQPEDSGVAVYFALDGEDYCLPCDRWLLVAENIAAIAAHLGAMRAMQRWGVGDIRTSFAGFAALPDPDRVIWRDVFGFARADRPTLDDVRGRYLELRSSRHPDKGGNPHEFDRVTKAWSLAQEELQGE